MPLIVAELSANHAQSLKVAKDSIKAIAKAGANALKLQTYTPKCLTLDSTSKPFIIKGGTLWDNMALYDLYAKAQTPWEWHKELFDLAQNLGLIAFSSPFSTKAVDFLESINCPMYKIASFEVMHYELIEAVARTKKPIILSTGVATHKEITRALEICKAFGVKDITLLHCVSEYPAKITDSNLLAMPRLAKTYKRYNVKFGLSDHTLSSLCPIIATSLGASMIEKHFILDKSLGGADAAFSMDFVAFSEMVESIKQTTLALGSKKPHIAKATKLKRRAFARSIWVKSDIKKGEVLSTKNIAILRPNGGANPKHFKALLGTKAKRNYKRAEPFIYQK